MNVPRVALSVLLAVSAGAPGAAAELPVETAAVEPLQLVNLISPRYRFSRFYHLFPHAIFRRYPPYSYALYPPFAYQPISPVLFYPQTLQVVPFAWCPPASYNSPGTVINIGGDVFARDWRADSPEREAQAPPPPPAEAPRTREPFYLERVIRPETVGLGDLARRQTQIEKDGPGRYTLRWTGPAEEVRSVEVRTLDARGGIELGTRPLTEPPFRWSVRLAPQIVAIEVVTEWRRGTRTAVRIPVSELE